MKANQKEILKNTALLISFAFLILNWNNIPLLFDGRVISSFINDVAHIYSRNQSVGVSTELDDSEINQSLKVFPESNLVYSDEENSISIPKIDIAAPIVVAQNAEEGTLVRDLNLGVALYPGSALPGNKGQTFLLGHSAPPNWPKIKYDWVFSSVGDLIGGDLVIVVFNHVAYTYRVTRKEIIDIGQEIQFSGVSSNSTLVLISCWPPGKNYKRIAIIAELQP